MSKLEDQIAEQIAAVEGSLTKVDDVFGNLNTLDYDEITKRMTSLDRAKYDLTNLYAINSLFWMYTKSFGEDPKALPIKEELDRIKQQMMRVKELGDKAKMPRVDKEVAQRLIKHELGNQKSNDQQRVPASTEENWDKKNPAQEPMDTDNSRTTRGKKRKFSPSAEGTEDSPQTSTTPSSNSNRDDSQEKEESVSDDEENDDSSSVSGSDIKSNK